MTGRKRKRRSEEKSTFIYFGGGKKLQRRARRGLDKTHHLHESSEASERARLKGFRRVLTPPKRIETFGVRGRGKPVGSELGVAVVKRV